MSAPDLILCGDSFLAELEVFRAWDRAIARGADWRRAKRESHRVRKRSQKLRRGKPRTVGSISTASCSWWMNQI